MKHRTAIYFVYALLISLFGFLPTVNAAPGDLDTTFSTDGKLVEVFGNFGNDYVYSSAVQTDGKIVVVGSVVYGSYPACGIARYNSNGSLDASFDGDGKNIIQIGAISVCNAVAIQTDGKIVAAGVSSNRLGSDFGIVRLNTDGSLDTSFDGDGKVITPISSSTDGAYAVTIQTDGKIVAAGVSNNATNSDFAVARYNTDGSLDTSFDGDGKVTTPILNSNDIANAVAIQTDGRIVVAGYSRNNNLANEFAVVRYNTNGSLDTSFDTDGKVNNAVLFDDYAYATAIQTDGKIIVTGRSSNGANYDFALVRYNTNGSLDTSFDGDGKVTTPILSADDSANAMKIQADGKIIATGYSNNGTNNNDFAAVRYNTDGSLDNSFDTDGKVTSSVLNANDQANTVAIQADGKIVAAGSSRNSTDDDFAVVRYNANGSLDTSFDTDGKTTNTVGSSRAHQQSVAVQTDGKIVVADSAFNGVNYDFAVIRYNADGTLDTSFDGDGKVTISEDGFDYSYAIAIQADGKIVVAGAGYFISDYDFVLVRYNTDGSLDTTFDGDGKVVTPVLNAGDSAFAVAIQADGKIVAAGNSNTNSNSVLDFAVVRYNSNGSLDSSFDGDGKVTTSVLASSSDVARAVTIQSDGKIVVAGETTGSNLPFDCAIVRYNPDGSLDTTFDGDGKVMTPSVEGNFANALAIQTDGKIVAGGSGYSNGFGAFALVRYNTNGSLDNSFDSDGIVITPASSQSSEANALAIQPNGKIIAAGSSFNSSGNYDFALIRYNSDGSLDNSFRDHADSLYGAGGKVVFDFGNGTDDIIRSMALDSSGRAVVAGSIGGLTGVARVLGDASALRRSPFDFDGDGKSDISIFRPAQGEWWYLRSSDGGNRAFGFGNSADKLVPGDYTGDGKTDVAVWRPTSGEWFILRSENLSYYSFPFGATGDVPVPFDYDGDGKTDAAVFRPSTATWYINRTTGGTQITQFGATGDVPAVGDYDGDGKADIAIHRPSLGQWWIQRSSNASVYAFNLGTSTDKPVQGDYTGDGKTDAAIWRPSTGEWFVLRSENFSFYSVPFGTNGDSPVAADYDGDGKTDIGVFRPSSNTWFINRSTAGILITNFGINGDKPVPSVFVP